MNSLKQEIQERGRYETFTKPTRIKVGRAVMIYAALPLMSAWAFPIGLALSMPLSPSVYAKKKIIEFKEWRMLR